MLFQEKHPWVTSDWAIVNDGHKISPGPCFGRKLPDGTSVTVRISRKLLCLNSTSCLTIDRAAPLWCIRLSVIMFSRAVVCFAQGRVARN
ncbi:hypothetical protein NPIL_227401 [Nephila pilipes]|uniref:Uncharacterized protein n=1 Tax=Nephila pilipes TaxID=299642 RepID=A0A8X6NSF4_NEPPI|nr:hypothetical protein NPIL_227401 [Nephila pilipes]